MIKDFQTWNIFKIKLNDFHITPTFKEREVWWCSIGVNVGHEEDGKSNRFNRPVLVIKKFNKHLFWGVPLTTKIKEIEHYHKFYFDDVEQCAMLTQMRLLDSKRITHKIGRLAENEFKDIKSKLKCYLE